jgi:hypothetical protein
MHAIQWHYINIHTYVEMYVLRYCSSYMNVMLINPEYEGPNYLVCDSIEKYLRFEQHCLCLVSTVNEEDMSIKNL